MTNPTTQTTTTSTTTTTTKPSAMERVKEKAVHLADKLSGRTHDNNHVQHNDPNDPGPGFHGNTANAVNPAAATYHAGQLPVNAQHSTDTRHNNNSTNQTTMPLHTGAAVGDAAVLQGNTVNRSAYQQQLDHNIGGGLPPAVPPKDNDRSQHHHGILGWHHGKHNKQQTTTFANPNTADPNPIHPYVIPNQQTANAGPTGASNIPTYNQNNIAPTAEQGVFPSSTMAGAGSQGLMDQNDPNHMSHIHGQTANMPSNTMAAGTQVPMNANNSAVPVNQQNQNQAVPAMGAPGTTTAQIPGQYVA